MFYYIPHKFFSSYYAYTMTQLDPIATQVSLALET